MTDATLSRRRFLVLSAGACGGALFLPFNSLSAAPEAVGGGLGPLDAEGRLGPLIHAPTEPGAWVAWRRALAGWRDRVRAQLGYDDALYRRADLAWAARCYACALVMMGDEAFLDPQEARFTLDRFLDHGVMEFGGYDALVLWHAYPRIGFDPRNQFDFYRDMPGGLAGLRDLSRNCHRRGVRVFINYNPWDTGTRREGKSDIEALATLVGEMEADGIFLDTLDRGTTEFRDRLDAVRSGVALESELALPVEGVADHHLSWAQWFNDGAVPGVLRNKWLERRHMMHQIRRWDRDHTGELHSAWMNGSGVLVWENVFGSWIGWNPRDRSILRAMLPIQRRYAGVFSGEAWTPLVPTRQPEVYASRWGDGDPQIWTLVNRSERAVDGPLLDIPDALPARYYDLVRGVEIPPVQSDPGKVIRGHLPPRGIGAILARREGAPSEAGLDAFLDAQRAMNARATWVPGAPSPLPTRLRPVRRASPSTPLPPEMIAVPGASFDWTVEFRTRECGFYESTPPGAGDWGRLNEPRLVTQRVTVRPHAIDLTPVTNGQFQGFLEASGYRPRHAGKFLAHWRDGQPPRDRLDHPVVYVSLEDARAYAAWAGKRLPTEEEWQYAAGGPQQLRYPWGDEMRPGVCNVGSSHGTTPVTAFPAGRSPFGGYDYCGNTWQWTESERSDGRTRFCILKGGSWFRAEGSHWYADGGPQPCRFAAKFLLLWPGLDRCSTIGFRCVLDLPG